MILEGIYEYPVKTNFEQQQHDQFRTAYILKPFLLLRKDENHCPRLFFFIATSTCFVTF